MTLRMRTRHVRSLLPAAAFCMAAALTPFSVLADTNLSPGDSAVVAYANGDNVNLRVGPGPEEAILTEIPEGSSVYVIDGLYTGADGSLWYQVEANGTVGFMVADFVASGYSAGVAVGGPSGGAVATEQVYVRTGPSTADAILGNLNAGDAVELTGVTSNGFYEIWYGDYVGYAYADYISPGGSADVAVAAEPVADEAAPDLSGPSGTYYTNDSVNLRAGAGTDNGVIAVVPLGSEVWLTGGVSNGFSQVSSAYGDGWISSDYLSASAPVAPEPEAPAPAPAGNSAIVDFAMQFQGYPYVWAGNTPSGFDCSGFTQYVVQNTLGYDITHSTDIQATHGSAVGWGEWLPGDLIFFVGTYEGGNITHVGIYIGDGLMIHAENPGTGVVISDITSGYYASHYYSATRL